MIKLPSKWPGLVATAKAEKQEPDDLTIAYMSGLHDGKKKRTWVGLTDEEIWEAYMESPVELDCNTDELYALSRTVEARLKDKNT